MKPHHTYKSNRRSVLSSALVTKHDPSGDLRAGRQSSEIKHYMNMIERRRWRERKLPFHPFEEVVRVGACPELVVEMVNSPREVESKKGPGESFSAIRNSFGFGSGFRFLYRNFFCHCENLEGGDGRRVLGNLWGFRRERLAPNVKKNIFLVGF